MTGTDEALPNPQRERGKPTINPGDARANKRNESRMFWVPFTTAWPNRFLRIMFGPTTLMLIIANMVFADRLSALHSGLGVMVAATVIFVPTVIASIYSVKNARDRLRRDPKGASTKDSFPGSERILGMLDDNQMFTNMRFLIALAAGLLLLSSHYFYISTTPHISVLIGAMLLTSFVIAQTIRLERTIQMTSRSFPLLSFHVPALHESQLHTVLSDLLLACLDPESAEAWQDWLEVLAPGVRGDSAPVMARERILQIVHLHQEGLLDELRMRAELRRVVRRETMEPLFDKKERFNIETLSVLLNHTRQWKPGLFSMLHRLRNGVLTGERSLTNQGWRMDHDLPLTCREGQGDLFVMLHNLTDQREAVVLEVLVPEGMPEVQTFRVTPVPTRPLMGPTPRTSMFGQDLVDGMGALLQRALVLWIGIAWTDEAVGQHPVQITLRRPDGDTIDSIIIRADIWHGSGGSESTHGRMKRAGARGFDGAVRVVRGSFSL